MGKKAKRRRKFAEVWEATYDWLSTASRNGLITVDWDADPVSPDDWDAACAAAGFDPDDMEVGFGRLVARSAENTALRVGDTIATDGSMVSVLRRRPRRRTGRREAGGRDPAPR